MRKKLLFVMCILLIATGLYYSISRVPMTSAYAQTTNSIENKMESLMTEIDDLSKNNEQLALNSNPYAYVENSKDYKEIVEMGVRAVKPLYDLLYKSPDAGLYEYILALAIQEITQQEYIYHVDYGWKNSLEFRLCYETKVNNSITDFEYIMNVKELSE